MRRSDRLKLALGLLLVVAGAAAAQAPSTPARPGSGDAWIDSRIADINRYGAAYPDAFVDELVRYQGAPREFVIERLRQGWAPGDLYYACSVATVLGRACRQVTAIHGDRNSRGWGEVTGQLGLKPGSAQDRRLRQGIAASYERWARPLQPEPALPAAPPKKAGASDPLPHPPAAPGEAYSKRR
ncbi:MAG: hypothetical protein AVDCRST_MAG71-1974 [uncultured Lysobacter sp.]|uniref:Secreted protein n=1 Tax=uncultured Lysobacter sp. TaxID=271060 RepID=A0A6J4LLK5_9GAMM|nr:MAG: hypothetical protein AVDCRST_MAG71-1974 [uncultured Lysobacter sp.]